MNKQEFITFILANSTIICFFCVVFTVAVISFLVMKAKKISKELNKAENLIKILETKFNDLNSDAYSINKYNKSTLVYIHDFRKILIEYKGKVFDTKLLNSIDSQLQEVINKEKFKDMDDFIDKSKQLENDYNFENHLNRQVEKDLSKIKKTKLYKEMYPENIKNENDYPFEEKPENSRWKKTNNKVIIKNKIKGNIPEEKPENSKITGIPINEIKSTRPDSYNNGKIGTQALGNLLKFHVVKNDNRNVDKSGDNVENITNKSMYCMGNTPEEIEKFKKEGFNIPPENSTEEFLNLSNK